MKIVKGEIQYKEEEVYIELSAKYIQNGDSNSAVSVQELEIHQEDAGGGKYFVIKTDRWAFNSIDELIEILNDYKGKIQ